MKKENFTLDLSTPLKRIARLSILPVLLIMLSLQANAQCPLGCNNSVQISLNNDCEVTVTPDMILEGQGSATCDYSVVVYDANNNPIPGAVVDGAYIGQTLQARVFLGNNSCWGTITIEDKLKPIIDCAPEVNISCYQTFNPSLPSVTDNCDSNPTISILSDVTTDLDCGDQSGLSARRVITYRAEDASGNVSDICTQTVNYERIGLADITFPSNVDGVAGNPAALSCDDYSADTWNEDNIFDCSSWTYTVGYAVADNNGNAPTDGIYYTDNVTGNSTSGYTITDLPLGMSWLRYTITDGCGNTTEAFTEVTVVDNVPPIAVCDEFTVVTLTSDGSAYAFAATFDDGSFDNCGEVTLSVRRPNGGCGAGNSYGDYVEFCCSDVGQDVMVELRVTEDRPGGLSNSCMVIVHVQDKIDPIITCPDPITVDCTVDYTDLSITGEPTGFDNCGGTITGPFDNVNIGDCGTGTVFRSWTITDAGGRTDNCTQTITITNNNVFNGNNPSMLSFPNDVTLMGCMNDNTDESQTGVPTINAGSCSLVAYTSSDKVFNFQDGACFKILRTFTVIDWCQYDPDATSPVGIWQQTQVIKLNNDIAPVFNGCTSTVNADVTGANCDGFVTLTTSATDDCPNVSEDELSFSFQFDEFNDGSINATGNSNDAAQEDLVYTFPNGTGNMTFDCDDVGMNTVEIIVTDEAGNSDFCSTTINIQSNDGCEGSRIAGTIATELSGDVELVEVMLEDMESQEERYFMTDETGYYQFFNIAENADYQVSELRKVILGVQPEFNNSDSWRFIDGAQEFFDATEPWPVNDKIDVEDFTSSEMNNNFVAIKIGDVNGTATNSVAGADVTEVRSSNTTLNVTNTIYEAGEEVRMDVRSDDFKAIAGLQFTLEFDETTLEYVTVESAKLDINASNIGAQLADRGEITASWNTATDVTAKSEEVLMTVIFRAKTNGDLSSMTMSADQISSEAYTTELSITGLDIEVRDENAVFTDAELVLTQNRPNPFTNTTNVSFTLPETGAATLSILSNLICLL